MQTKIEYRKQFIGKQQQVLIDTINASVSKGYGEFYIPVKVNQKLQKNQLYTMQIVDIEEQGNEPCLLGKLID